MVIKSSFDPKIEWAMPEGEVPFKANDVPMGTEHTVLAMEVKNCGTLLKVQTILHLNIKKKQCLYRC